MKYNLFKRGICFFALFLILFVLINCSKENLRNENVERITDAELSDVKNKIKLGLNKRKASNATLFDKPLVKFASLIDTTYIGVLAPIYFKEKTVIKGILSLKFNKKNEIIEETLYALDQDMSVAQLDTYEYYIEVFKEYKYEFTPDIITNIKKAKAIKKKPNVADSSSFFKSNVKPNLKKRANGSSTIVSCAVNFAVQFTFVSHCDQQDEWMALSSFRYDFFNELKFYLNSHIQEIGGQITRVSYTPPYVSLGGNTTHPIEHPLGYFRLQSSTKSLIEEWIRSYVIRPFPCLGNRNINVRITSFDSQCSGNSELGSENGGGGSNNTQMPFSNFLSFITQKPFILIPNIECAVVEKWVEIADFVPNNDVFNKLDELLATPHIVPGLNGPIKARIQSINNAYSSVVNMDDFSIRVDQLPVLNGTRMTPSAFLEYIRLNLNQFVNNNLSIFEPYNYYTVNDTYLWNSSNPTGAIIGIDIPGPDNGSVIVSDSSPTEWTFTTINDPKYHDHPVSGNRKFGYEVNSDGSHTFYTRGVDRITNWDATFLQSLADVPFSQADALWASFQGKVTSFVNQRGGSATIKASQKHRPDWSLVKKVLNGEAPLSTLSTDCD